MGNNPESRNDGPIDYQMALPIILTATDAIKTDLTGKIEQQSNYYLTIAHTVPQSTLLFNMPIQASTAGDSLNLLGAPPPPS